MHQVTSCYKNHTWALSAEVPGFVLYDELSDCKSELFSLVIVSLPKLIDFDWRVDVKTSSNAISRMSMPTCIMQLQVSGMIPFVDKVSIFH